MGFVGRQSCICICIVSYQHVTLYSVSFLSTSYYSSPPQRVPVYSLKFYFKCMSCKYGNHPTLGYESMPDQTSIRLVCCRWNGLVTVHVICMPTFGPSIYASLSSMRQLLNCKTPFLGETALLRSSKKAISVTLAHPEHLQTSRANLVPWMWIANVQHCSTF